MELIGDSDDEGTSPTFGVQSSEHILNKKKAPKKAKNSQFLEIGGKDDDEDSTSSAGSENKTMVKSASGNLLEGKMFRRKLCPNTDMYLDSKAKERPKRLKTTKFLSDNSFEKVVIANYQKSGATVLRKYIENITGIFTGSDGDVFTPLDKQLLDKGLEGESVLGSKVWIAQTNFPEKTGNSRVSINKVVLLARNPMDSIYSHFNMIATKSIDKKLTEDEFEKFQDAWEAFVKQEISIWREFYDWWMLQPFVPTLVIRYEDLIEHPAKVLKQMFAFLLNVKDVTGTLISTLIDAECAEENKEYYSQPKPLSASKHAYTEELLEHMRKEAGCVLERLGYVNGVYGARQQLTKTDFFDDADIEDSKQYEKDTILRNTREEQISYRLAFDDLNFEQHAYVTSDKYKKKAENGKLDSIEINLDIESKQLFVINFIFRCKKEEWTSKNGKRSILNISTKEIKSYSFVLI